MTPLIALAIQEAPAIFDRLRALFHKSNPTDPLPTDAEVIAAYQAAFQSSIDKDNAWLSAHGG